MSSHSPIKIICGSSAGFEGKSTEEVQELLDILKAHDVLEIDTSSSHQGKEALLRDLGVTQKMSIHTKALVLAPKAMSKQNMLAGMEKSLTNLGLETINLYYLHGPDPTTPIQETLEAIQELYAAGKLKRFGLANFTVKEVQEIYDIQAAASSVLPTVYSSNYNAVARHPEAELLPLILKLKMSFYAYSPIGGGFLAQNLAKLRAGKGAGRYGWDNLIGDLQRTLFCKGSLIDALEQFQVIAREAGITQAALAFRWITYHSMLKGENGDAIIIGASSTTQLQDSLSAIEDGPLDEETAKKVDNLWPKIEHEAPGDYYHDYLSKLGNPIGAVHKLTGKEDR